MFYNNEQFTYSKRSNKWYAFDDFKLDMPLWVFGSFFQQFSQEPDWWIQSLENPNQDLILTDGEICVNKHDDMAYIYFDHYEDEPKEEDIFELKLDKLISLCHDWHRLQRLRYDSITIIIKEREYSIEGQWKDILAQSSMVTAVLYQDSDGSYSIDVFPEYPLCLLVSFLLYEVQGDFKKWITFLEKPKDGSKTGETVRIDKQNNRLYIGSVSHEVFDTLDCFEISLSSMIKLMQEWNSLTLKETKKIRLMDIAQDILLLEAIE